MMAYNQIVSAVAVLFTLLMSSAHGAISLGSFPEDSMQDVAGEVVVISNKVIEIRNFVYSGEAPDAFFWADDAANATRNGFILLQSSNDCSDDILEYADGNSTITLEFPGETGITGVLGGSISVWCRTMFVNLGQVVIPDTLEESLLASEDDVSLQCATVEERSWLERIVDTATTLWNVAVWFVTPQPDE